MVPLANLGIQSLGVYVCVCVETGIPTKFFTDYQVIFYFCCENNVIKQDKQQIISFVSRFRLLILLFGDYKQSESGLDG